MSTKEQTWEPGTMMTCDGATGPLHCGRQVRRAPYMRIPSKTPGVPGHKPLIVMTTLHYCEEHRDSFDPAVYWTDKQKARLEAVAKKRRPAEFRPDFENVTVKHVLVTTPEYRQFMASRLGIHNVAA